MMLVAAALAVLLVVVILFGAASVCCCRCCCLQWPAKPAAATAHDVGNVFPALACSFLLSPLVLVSVALLSLIWPRLFPDLPAFPNLALPRPACGQWQLELASWGVGMWNFSSLHGHARACTSMHEHVSTPFCQAECRCLLCVARCVVRISSLFRPNFVPFSLRFRFGPCSSRPRFCLLCCGPPCW